MSGRRAKDECRKDAASGNSDAIGATEDAAARRLAADSRHESSSRQAANRPSPAAVENEIVSALSHWLAFHLGNEELLARLRSLGIAGLDSDQAEAVEELVDELERSGEGTRGELEMLVRETMEVVVLGG